MISPVTYGSVCSGIEAATVAWHKFGWQPAWFSEIEPFPCAVLQHHYPHVPNLGDMTKIHDRVKTGEVAAPAVLVGGTPCQAFSVAGLKNSLDDERGQLTLEYVRLLDAIDTARLVRGECPAVAVWENVPGVFSTKDNAFGCFLGALAGEGCELQPPRGRWHNAGYIVGPQRQVAWRTLDAQFFGLAQRRKRVFVVASAMDGFNPAEVLFERAGMCRDTTQGGSQEQDIAGTITRSAGRSRGAGISPECLVYRESAFGAFAPSITAATLKKRGGCAEGGSESLIVEPYLLASGNTVSGTLLSNAGTKKWQGNQEAFSGDFFVIHGTQDPLVNKNIAHCLGRNRGQENAVCYGIPGNWVGRAPANGGNAVEPPLEPPLELSPCLTKTDRHAVAECFQQNTRDEVRFIQGDGSIAGCLTVKPGVKQQNYLMVRSRVRRFMPIECERLQGFPDNYTLIPTQKLKTLEPDVLEFLCLIFPGIGNAELQMLAQDGPRYAALGNSMPVNVMAWLGMRIHNYLSLMGVAA